MSGKRSFSGHDGPRLDELLRQGELVSVSPERRRSSSLPSAFYARALLLQVRYSSMSTRSLILSMTAARSGIQAASTIVILSTAGLHRIGFPGPSTPGNCQPMCVTEFTTIHASSATCRCTRSRNAQSTEASDTLSLLSTWSGTVALRAPRRVRAVATTCTNGPMIRAAWSYAQFGTPGCGDGLQR